MATPFDPYAIQANKIARNRAIADALIKQSQQPLGNTQMVSGVAVPMSPIQGIAKLAEAYKGTKYDKQQDQATEDLAAKRRADIADAISGFTKATTPTPGTPTTYAQDVPGVATEIPGQAPFTPSPADRQAAALKLAGQVGDPGDAAKMMVAQALTPPKYQALPAGGTFGQNHAYRRGRLSRQLPDKPTPAPGSVQQYEYAKGQGYTGTYNDWLLEQKKAGAPTVNLTQKQEGAESAAVGSALGKKFNDIQDAGYNAQQKINTYDQLGMLLQGVDTGALTPSATKVEALGQALGFKVDTKTLGAKQAAMAIGNQLALQLRNPAGGAGMPGAMSDKDREFLVSQVPGLAQTPQGNAMLIDAAKKVAQRDIEVAQLARDYRSKHGHMDEGFYTELAQWSAQHPLFSGSSSPAAPSGGSLTPNPDGSYNYNP